MFKNIRKIFVALLLVLLLSALVGCSKGEDETQNGNDEVVENNIENNIDDKEQFHVKDNYGNDVTFDKAPSKIISLAPSNTEILFALGLGNKVVGVTSFDDYPEEVLDIEKIGDFTGINLEKIIELEPDLVINYGPGNEDENSRLKEAGIEIIGFLPESIDEVIDTILKIGEITGAINEAKELSETMLAKKDEITNKVKNEEKVKVFYEIWHEPLMAAGPGSFMDHLINLAGGENIAKDAKDAYPQFDLEQLIERDPDVYLTSIDVPEKTKESMINRPGYENISAMKSGRVYLLDANVVSRPGPRIIEALELVAKAIHPEIFE